MNTLKEFSLPIKGLKNGFHSFNFQIDQSFFAHFEASPIQVGAFDVAVDLDKRDSFFELTFDFDGTMQTDCDRCTATINLPFGDTQYLTVKMSEDLKDEPEEADIVFISPDAHEFNIAQYIYEFVCLAAPYHKIYDCENDDPRPCDLDILKKLTPIDPSVSDDISEKKMPFEGLKNLFDNEN